LTCLFAGSSFASTNTTTANESKSRLSIDASTIVCEQTAETVDCDSFKQFELETQNGIQLEKADHAIEQELALLKTLNVLSDSRF